MKKNTLLILLTAVILVLNQPAALFAASDDSLHCRRAKAAHEIVAIQSALGKSQSPQDSLQHSPQNPSQDSLRDSTQASLQNALSKASGFIKRAVPAPQYGSIGGEWTIIGLARSDESVSADYYNNYYTLAENHVKECNGLLSKTKNTEYSRLATALTAIGKDPQNVAGYSLLLPLGDYETTVLQGINGPVWALIALDCGNYSIPENKSAKVRATRTMYVDYILERRLDNGGWNLTSKDGSGEADPDVTAMSLQALAKYTERKDVSEAVGIALSRLSELQGENGGYSSWGTENSESTAQVLVALCELGIDINDKRFVKNGKTLLDSLLEYQTADGGFRHAKSDTEANLMASEQCLYALAAAMRAQSGKSSLYRMNDITL
ncbi:MAG: terpene cyclase/mutase family protein [Clostridia bacterium]|nr:terpene cyclase/mutase family protein [Clostridia bacterium]